MWYIRSYVKPVRYSRRAIGVVDVADRAPVVHPTTEKAVSLGVVVWSLGVMCRGFVKIRESCDRVIRPQGRCAVRSYVKPTGGSGWAFVGSMCKFAHARLNCPPWYSWCVVLFWVGCAGLRTLS